jgi:lipopolysaccharide/colanic/teichoic acid biosynthesis glycosyltransferase
MSGTGLSLKSFFDFFLSFTGLIVLSPIFIVSGCLIRLNDKGPVFFRQRRVGKGGKIFTLFKFRSMRVSESSGAGIFEPGESSRVTTVGRFLRRTKLDELPQLINVLKGDMSIVGPRPEVEKWVAAYPEKWKRVLTVKPGITDMASIEFRNEEKLLSESSDPENTYRNEILPLKLELCLEYVNNRSFAEDLRIIALTIKTVLLK